jgi:hypothetical protein
MDRDNIAYFSRDCAVCPSPRGSPSPISPAHDIDLLALEPTFIAVINPAREEMPLWVTCKGTTGRCSNRFRLHFWRDVGARELILFHRSSGWTDRKTATSVADELTVLAGAKPHCVLWEIVRAHREKEVKPPACPQDTTFVFVPPGHNQET